MFRRSVFACLGTCIVSLVLTANEARAADAALSAALAGLGSTTASVRAASFEALLGIPAAQPTLTGAPRNVPILVTTLLGLYPSDADSIRVALINALAAEESYVQSLPDPPVPPAGVDETESVYGEYYADLIGAVATLQDIRALALLLPHLQDGRFIIDSVAALGPQSVDPVISLLLSPGLAIQGGAEITLVQMAMLVKSGAISDAATISKIHAGLNWAFRLEANNVTIQNVVNTAIGGLPRQVPGDLNGDGVVNCKDVALIRAAFGTKAGQAGFDIRADVNGDGKVNGADLTALRKLAHNELECENEGGH